MTWKSIFFTYQRVMWYAQVSKNEYAKIGSFIPETLGILIYLQIRGIQTPIWQVPLYYVCLMIVAAAVGKILTVIGVMRYGNKLSNEHNEELSEILRILKTQNLHHD